MRVHAQRSGDVFWTGHKTATLTLDRYGHPFPDDLGRIADAFGAAAELTADWTSTQGSRLDKNSSSTGFPVPPLGLEPRLCGF
jgi:hypothetical protein